MNQTVTVTTKNTASLTLGIISLILGVLGLLVGWVPFLGIIGMPAAIIGGLLGILGIVLAVIKGFNGLVMPILGSCICLLAFILPIASTGLVAKSIEHAVDHTAEAENTSAVPEATDPGTSHDGNSVALPQDQPDETEKPIEPVTPKETLEEIYIREYIRDFLEVYEVSAKYTDTFTEKHIPSVTFKLKNKGDVSLDLVEVVFYFLDADGNRIAEENYRPVSVSQFSFGDNKPLKPGYVWSQEKGKVYTAKSVPSEWKEGAIEYEISEIEFTPKG